MSAATASGYDPVLPALILLLPLLGFALNGLGAFLWRDVRAVPSLVGPLAVIGSFAVVAVNLVAMAEAGAEGPAVVSFWTWMAVGGLEVGVDLLFDRLSVLMMLIVTGVSAVIHVYSVGYMRDDPGYSRYFSYLNLFVFFMLVLVAAGNFPLTFVGWEGVGLCSYLLIGFWYENRDFSNAGKKAFLVNRVGDVGFLVAMFLLFSAFGTLDFLPIFESAPEQLRVGGIVVTGITLALFLACVGKSAQIPLTIWLPDAMAGPTPVSALIHAATMVTAGVYLVARAGVLFSMAPVSQAVVATVGAGTALYAATVALRQYDIKKVLAYSTISQLGYMFIGVGVGAFAAGIFHLMTHAFFKALLFLGAGAVIHALEGAWEEMGVEGDPNDMRNHGGLRDRMPVTWVGMWAATLAIAGVFPFSGFFSKDEILWHAGTAGYPLLWGVGLVAALLTAAYMTRLMVMTFHGTSRSFADASAAATGEEGPDGGAEVGGEGAGQGHSLHEAPPVMAVPIVLLAVLSLAGGWVAIPAALPLPEVELLHAWLEPTFERAHAVAGSHAAPGDGGILGGGEALWAGIATALAVGVVVWVFRRLGTRRYAPAARAPEPAGVDRVLYRAWYVDELYEQAVVRPLLALWRACWRLVDVRIVDGTVNGLGATSRMLGWVGSQLQSGRVGTYVTVFVLGTLVVLGSLVI